MIVTCERCDTEFQLDDTRVPESGARVRCSRCKHAFFVARPAAEAQEAPPASSEELFDRAAESALIASETPGVTEDLPDPRASDLFGELPREREEAAPAPSADGDSEESDWQFNADPPAEREERAPERPRAAQPPGGVERRRTPQPATEELGSPSEWDIFDDVAAEPEEDPAPAPRASAPRRSYFPGYFDRAESPMDAPSPFVERIVSGLGGIATAGLFAIALWHGLAPSPTAETTWSAPAPGVVVEGVRGRWVENLYEGRLYVVSGQLRNESPSAFVAVPPLELELRDGSGRPVEQSFPVAEPLSPGRLREADGSELRSAAAFRGSLGGGETRPFEIVAWPLPAAAERFAIRAAASGARSR